MATGDKIGVCPICGADVVENSKAYGCSHWRESDGACKFTVWKTIAKREMKPEEIEGFAQNCRSYVAMGQLYRAECK